MTYYIQRGATEYGPYTVADLQRYVAQGNIALTDLARGETMTEWIPVSQILGNIAVPPPPAPAPPAPGGVLSTPVPAGVLSTQAPGAGMVSAGGTVAAAAPAMVVPGPVPPDFHWAAVLAIGFFCGIFQFVWLFIEAAFVKKIKPDSNHLAFLITGMGLQFGAVIIFYAALFAQFATNPNSQDPPWAALVLFFVGLVAGIVVYIMGIFKTRAAIEDYYNTVEPIHLRLSGVMTFFFSIFYFQYHFSRIANWKRTGYLEPQ